MNRKLLLGTILLFLSVSLHAQSDSVRYNGITTLQDNWYVELSIGGNVLFSQDARLNVGAKNLTPSISLTAGKWLSPFIGARLQMHGYSLAAGSTSFGNYISDKLVNGCYGNYDPVREYVTIRPDGSYTYPIYYMNIHTDVTLSLLNLINKGMAATDHWDVIPAVGVGYMHVFNNKGVPASDVVTGNFSIMGKYRILPELDVNVEVQTTLMPDMFEGRLTGAVADPMFSFGVGVTYNINGHNFKGANRISEAYVHKARKKRLAHTGNNDSIYHYMDKNNMELINKLNSVEQKVDAIKDKEKENNQPINLIISDEESLRQLDGKVVGAIVYVIGSDVPVSPNTSQFLNIVEILHVLPNAKIRVEGYADKATGNAELNMKLAEARVKHAVGILLNEYGVDKDRVESVAYGDKQTPYEQLSDEELRSVVFRLIL